MPYCGSFSVGKVHRVTWFYMSVYATNPGSIKTMTSYGKSDPMTGFLLSKESACFANLTNWDFFSNIKQEKEENILYEDRMCLSFKSKRLSICSIWGSLYWNLSVSFRKFLCTCSALCVTKHSGKRLTAPEHDVLYFWVMRSVFRQRKSWLLFQICPCLYPMPRMFWHTKWLFLPPFRSQKTSQVMDKLDLQSYKRYTGVVIRL